MKIVIDIDDKIYNDAKNGYVRLGEISDAVLSGTPYEERQSGEWATFYPSYFCNPECLCPFCGRVVEFSENFCPDCGADMREVHNE